MRRWFLVLLWLLHRLKFYLQYDGIVTDLYCLRCVTLFFIFDVGVYRFFSLPILLYSPFSFRLPHKFVKYTRFRRYAYRQLNWKYSVDKFSKSLHIRRESNSFLSKPFSISFTLSVYCANLIWIIRFTSKFHT